MMIKLSITWLHVDTLVFFDSVVGVKNSNKGRFVCLGSQMKIPFPSLIWLELEFEPKC